MATNLRLEPEAAAALRETAKRTGRSQQDLIREAIDRFLGLRPLDQAPTELERLVADGKVFPPTPYARVEPHLKLPDGVTSLDLLDSLREDGR